MLTVVPASHDMATPSAGPMPGRVVPLGMLDPVSNCVPVPLLGLDRIVPK